jgi:DNA (cytosine-5)-methyltransferase 1
MKYLSVCSGIEAATVAWHPLGWEPLAFADIEPFPRALLAHHYPHVPLHGDFTVLKDQPWIVDADVLVGGTPCQAFSVAGLRNSLADDRGNLSLEYVRLADAIDDVRSAAGRPPVIAVWENVPGVLSVKDNAFGCFLAALAGEDAPLLPTGGKWTNAGVALGPARAIAWRILDAQYFGLAQRRRRVFVVASARAGFDPAAILLEFEGLRRDTPPRRETGQDAASGTECRASVSSGSGWWSDSSGLGATLRAQDSIAKADTLVHGGTGQRSHWDGMENPHPTLNQSFNTGAIGYSNQELFSQRGAGLVGEASTGDISHCLNAGGMGRQDYETETLVTHALRGEGFDGSEDGTGRGTPLVPVAFSAKDHGADASEDLSPTLRAMPHHGSHANGGGQMAVAVPLLEVGKRTGVSTDDPRAGIGIGQDGDPMFTLQAGAQHGVALSVSLRGRDGGGTAELGGDIQNALRASQGGGDKPHVLAATFQQSSMKGKGTIGYDDSGIAKPVKTQMDGQMLHQHMAVRRLTPVECERLQGFPSVVEFPEDDMTRDEIIALALAAGHITADTGLGKAYCTRGPGGVPITPVEIGGVGKGGYIVASVCVGKVRKQVYLHRVIWIAENGMPPDGLVIDHINNDKTDNRIANLQLLTARENSYKARDDGLYHKDDHPLTKATVKVRERIFLEYQAGGVSYSELAERYGLTKGRIGQIVREYGYTNIPWRGKPEAPDGPRYKALGNSMAVPCMRWIGRRIVEALK